MSGLRLFYFFFFVALGIYSPAFPRWLEAHGIAGFELGLIAATSPVMGLLSPPFFGWLADRTGLRRSMVAVTTGLAALAVALLAVLTATGAPGFALTLGCVAVFAFFRAPMGSLADTIALESGAPYGPLRLWGSLGFLLAAVAAGRWLDPTSPGLLFAIATALACAGIVAWWLPARSRMPGASASTAQPGSGALSLLRQDPALRLLFVCALCFEMAHSAYDLCFSLHLRDEGLTPGTAGILWAVGVLAEVGFFLVAERLLERYGAAPLLVLGAAATALRLGLLSVLHGVPALVLLQSLHALTFGATWTALMRIVRDESRPESLGALRAMVSATAAVGGAGGMLVWGTAYRSFGSSLTFRGAAGVAVLATLFALACARRLGLRPSHRGGLAGQAKSFP